MVRDQKIQSIFEIADDSLQGVLGYHSYVNAIYLSSLFADFNNVKDRLPTISGEEAFTHTFTWVRYYRKEDLIKTFLPPFFELFQARFSLIAITSIFDDMLDNFIVELKSKGHPPQLNGKGLGKNPKYWERLKWAFYESQKCTIGDLKAIDRLPKTFGIIDEARVLRNLIIHNHGIFNKRYEKDKIDLEDIKKIIHPDYQKFKDTDDPIPIIITHEDVVNFSRAHVEVLHILHNQIQKEYFGHPDPYDYRKENKNIEWDYVFWGNAKKGGVEEIIMRKSYLTI